MIRSRSGNGANALFTALIVSHSKSSSPQPKRVGELHHLVRHRRVAHQPVVGVDRHPEAQPAQHPDRVLGDARAHARVDVGGRAQLERDAAVADVRRQTSELLLAAPAGDVVDEADAVSEAGGTAVLHGLPDAREAERLAGMDRRVEVLAHHVPERVEMAGRRVAGLGAGDVEADDARITPAHRQLGDLEALRRGSHRRRDRVERELGAGAAVAESGEHRVQHLVEREPGDGVELGREADLGVDDTVGGEILGALERHPLERVAVLHHADRVGERLEVQHEVVALGTAVEPRRELGDVVGRQAAVSELVGELDDGARAYATVEVVVEQRLGRTRDEVGVHRVTVPSWSCRSDRDAAVACRRVAAASSTPDTRQRPRCSAREYAWRLRPERLTSLQWGSLPSSRTSVPAGTSSGTRSSGGVGSGDESSSSNTVPPSSVSAGALEHLA